MMNYSKLIIANILLCISGFCQAADTELAQQYFPQYKIISGDSIFLYSDNSSGKIKYGYCYFDSHYNTLFSGKLTSFSATHRKSDSYLNSRCYTIIPPIFEKAQPFSEGYGVVCMNGKWAYISSDNSLLTDFCFDAAMPIKNGIAQVMLNGNIRSIPLHQLNSYSPAGPTSLDHHLIIQLFNESQCEIAHTKAIDFINLHSPSIDKDFSDSDLVSLCLVCSYGKRAQDKLMAMTMGNRSDLYNLYSSRYIDANLSFLQSSPILADLICQDIINSSRCLDDNAELMNIKSLFEKKDYKRAVVTLESYFNTFGDYDKSSPLFTVYALLLSLSNDFESLWSVACDLRPNPNDVSLDNIVRNAFSYRFASAINLATKALKNKSFNYKKENILSLLGCLYSYHSMDVDKATDFYSQVYGNKGYDAALVSEALANSILVTNIDNDYAKVLDDYYVHESSYAMHLFKHNNVLDLSRKWGASKSRIDQVVDCLLNRGDEQSLLAAYKLSLLTKNILTDEQLDWQRLAKFNDDSKIRRLYAEYDSLKSKYGGTNIFDLDSSTETDVLNKLCELESQIKNDIFAEDDSFAPYRIDIKSILKTLSLNNAVGVEFITYHVKNIPWYGAFVLSSNSSSPKFIKIMNEYDLVEYKKAYREKNTESIQNFYESTFGNELWSHFDFTNHKHIYFATAGLLDEIGVEFLNYKGGRSLFEDFFTYRVKSTSIIPNLNSEITSRDGIAALYGGLDYGTSSFDANRGSVSSGKLKFSGIEVDEIDNILSDSFQTRKYVAKEGTPNSFRELCNVSPAILHFATHGYQRNKSYQKSYLTYEDRFNYYRQNTDIEDADWLLSNTGLRLSADSAVTDSINNLILSREIANSRLQNTSLVVLSACNTSDGASSDSYDCILGLNFAFQKANVKNLITSLWNVYDNTSYEFMKYFYTELNSSNIHDAFYTSVSKMKGLYPNNPEIWSSFILIEN